MHSFLSSLTVLTQYQVIPIAKQDCPRVQHAWTPRSHNTFNILENLRSPRDRRINALPTLATCFAKSMSVSEWLPRSRLQDYIYMYILYIYSYVLSLRLQDVLLLHWSHLNSDEPSERKTGMERLGSKGEINPSIGRARHRAMDVQI